VFDRQGGPGRKGTQTSMDGAALEKNICSEWHHSPPRQDSLLAEVEHDLDGEHVGRP